VTGKRHQDFLQLINFKLLEIGWHGLYALLGFIGNHAFFQVLTFLERLLLLPDLIFEKLFVGIFQKIIIIANKGGGGQHWGIIEDS